jgi:hypothetical protein
MREPGIENAEQRTQYTERRGGHWHTSAEVVDVMSASTESNRSEKQKGNIVVESGSNVNLSQYTSLHSLLNC